MFVPSPHERPSLRSVLLLLSLITAGSTSPPACVFSAASPATAVGLPCAASDPLSPPCRSFPTASAAMAACAAQPTCSAVASQAGGGPPWELRGGKLAPSPGGSVAFAIVNPRACGHPDADPATPTQVGFHNATVDAAGNLMPPAFFNFSVQAAMDASVVFYDSAPPGLWSHGFPPWVWSTFTDGDYRPTSTDIVAAMSDGLGILGYVKYYARAAAGRGGPHAAAALRAAKWLADYLINYAGTLPVGAWPSVARSTGVNTAWPLNRSSQHDANSGQNCIETDKVGIVGYALLALHEAAGEAAGGPYFAAALHHARVLAANQGPGNATHAPWPWRVDSVSGAFLWGRKNANVVYNLRLFRALARAPYSLPEFEAPAAALWAWVEGVLLLSADAAVNATASMFVNFYEDRPFNYAVEVDRTSWPALMLANYLLEERGALDPKWVQHVEELVTYALTLFGREWVFGNVTLTGEQDDDNRGWGGAGSKLGGVMARWACSGAGPAWALTMAKNNLAHIAHYSDVDGCRTDAAWYPTIRDGRGGWTEDCWLDVLHSVIDGLEALDGVC